MKYIGLVLVVVLATGAALMPSPESPSPGPSASLEETPVAICGVEEGSGRSTGISVLSTVDGPVALTLFASGSTAGSIGHTTGGSGSITIPVVDVAAVGIVGGLVEMPTATSAAGAVVIGAESMSAESCASMPSPQTFLTGATTASGDTFELHLMNPYAGEAVAELTVQSEAGIESNTRFESVIVPPRSSTIVDFTELVPGRETLSIAIDTVRGRVITVGRQGVSGESAVWKAVSASQDWFVAVPRGPGIRHVIVGTPANTEIEYQVDYYGPGGLEEGFEMGTIAPRGQAVVNLGAVTEEAVAIRVISTGPVVPTLWMESGEGLAVTTGSVGPTNRWFLPGAGAPEGGWATVVIANVGLDTSAVSIRSLREGTRVRSIELDADTVIELSIEAADGYLIESVGETVVMWSGHRDTASTAALGVPIVDG